MYVSSRRAEKAVEQQREGEGRGRGENGAACGPAQPESSSPPVSAPRAVGWGDRENDAVCALRAPGAPSSLASAAGLLLSVASLFRLRRRR